ncbi:MAG: glycosyltransferase family 2 protein [Magnetococcales bacterium]|nr:glycosyltransferase family 2 protein [Magnetococcales bacterium]
MNRKKKISIVIPSFNEVKNIGPMYQTVKKICADLPNYDSEFIFADNNSTDGTVEILRALASADPQVKVILNSRNYGHIRSPYHAMVQSSGDCVICLVSDFQDPPELIPEMIEKWEAGNEIVLAVRTDTEASATMEKIRGYYYRLVEIISEVGVIKNFTGYGLYDKKIVDIFRKMDDPYPYSRGMLSEIGFNQAKIEYTQKKRRSGISRNNFFTLFDFAMLGITSTSKVPLRLITMTGFALAICFFIIALIYFAYKLIYWDNFQLGLAPMVIGQFFFNGVLLIFLGILGEYVGFIHTRMLKRPVLERERINFDDKPEKKEESK